ncbi:hypothetical protein H5410_042210 [Solanum commersonii]|uniref:Uncharacterized protein n=1 Tax=Solanum commersonii TaxID=4109 RepID=A0A9J5XWV3_SOLCO|nr:hypothetical protein H5410_042210 [Solanum commersonii]
MLFGDPKFRHDFFQNFSWTFVKTLDIDPVGPDGKIDPFSMSNEPRACKPPILSIFRTSVKTLVIEPVRFDDWSRRANQPIFKVEQTLEQLVSTGKLAHFKSQTSLEQLLSKLVLMGKPAHFKGQTIQEQNYNVILAKIFHKRLLRP